MSSIEMGVDKWTRPMIQSATWMNHEKQWTESKCVKFTLKLATSD